MQTRSHDPLADVFSVAELARAAGTPVADVQAWVEAGAIRALPVGDGITWIARSEALRAGRALLGGTLAADVALAAREPQRLFSRRRSASRPAFGGPLAVSSGLHVLLLGAIVLITTLGLARATTTTESPVEPEPMRLVYLALPGPGGGGGGGGEKARTPPPKAERKGINRLDSPVPVRLSPVFGDPPPRPNPPKPEPLPDVVAPVVQVAANTQDRPGVVEPSPSQADSRGPGQDGGVGTGAGTGVGGGEGAGIGEGEGGGTGGGPYRPGSGVLPPSLLREVKPDYTEDARRRGIRGEVLMEIVVRRDGAVGDVKVLDGLGYGLDERAIAAVRQWKFSPATLHGKVVDVVVEVSMEFRLR